MLGKLFGYGQNPKYPSSPSAHSDEQQQQQPQHPADAAAGSLYVTSTNADGSPQQKCVYMSCVAYVRSTAQQHSFELVVSRTEQTDDDHSDSVFPADVVFTIDSSARFECEHVRFAWNDRAAKRYNLDIDEESDADLLRRDLAVALFQNLHGLEPGPNDEDELRHILVKPQPPKLSDLLETAGELLRVSGELFKFDVDANSFQSIASEVVVTINSAIVKEDNSRAYMMMVYQQDTGNRIMECEINNDMNGQFYTASLSIVWILNLDPDASNQSNPREIDPQSQICFSIKVENAEDYVRLRNQYSVCLYEVNNQASIDDLKKDEDKLYVEDSIRDDVEPMDVDSDIEEVEDVRQLRDEPPSHTASVDTVDDGMYNSHLAVSASNDRTFVVRGNKMGVFQTGDDGAQFKTMIEFKDPSKQGTLFNPSNIMLHEMDSSMLVLDPNDSTKLQRMDLERGEIVDTWSGDLMGNTPIKAVQRSEKYANLTDTKQFVGINQNQLLRMDPRSREFIVQSKKYAPGTRARLDCVATTGAGYLAVASENGDIRLFDQIGKNAKTHLPGLGDRIIGIDVSEDGNYVLASTARYLLIVDTRVKGEAKGGFLKSMGKNKPAPRKLTIKPEDVVKYKMGEISFTAAHFNTGPSLERSIVTSTGPYIVTWNFRAVKLGRMDSYKVKRYQDNIVADDFAYNNDGRIVVTLPNDVSVARR